MGIDRWHSRRGLKALARPMRLGTLKWAKARMAAAGSNRPDNRKPPHEEGVQVRRMATPMGLSKGNTCGILEGERIHVAVTTSAQVSYRENCLRSRFFGFVGKPSVADYPDRQVADCPEGPAVIPLQHRTVLTGDGWHLFSAIMVRIPCHSRSPSWIWELPSSSQPHPSMGNTTSPWKSNAC